MLCLDAADDSRPIVLGRRAAGTLAPCTSEHLIGYEHRHVTPYPVALGRDPAEGLGYSVPQLSRESIELHHVRPRREVGISPTGHDPSRCADERLGLLVQVLLGSMKQAFRPLARPWVIGGHVIGDVVQDQAQPPGCELRARCRQSERAAESLVDRVVAHAIWRTDDVASLQVREGCTERALQARVGKRDAKSFRAPLPHSHQPDRIDRQRSQRIPLGVRHLVEPQWPPAAAPESLEPCGRVDLVHGESARQPHATQSPPRRRGLQRCVHAFLAGCGRPYSYESAARTFSLPARRAGQIAAIKPVMTAAITNTTRVPTGTVNVPKLIVAPIRAAKRTPSGIPNAAPSKAVMTLS